MVSADDVSRSLRGAAGLLNRRADALGAFDASSRGFAGSFWAVALTVPAFVVSLALQRRELGLDVTGRALFDDTSIALAVGCGHIAGFLAFPLAMVFVLRRSTVEDRCVPFVVATNWVAVFGSFILAVPGVLYLFGLETEALTKLFTIGFGAIVVHAQWFAAKATLRVGGGRAALVAGLWILLRLSVSGVVGAMAV